MADIDIKCPECDTVTAVSEFIDSDSASCKSCGIKLEIPKKENEIKPIDKLRLKKKEIPEEGSEEAEVDRSPSENARMAGLNCPFHSVGDVVLPFTRLQHKLDMRHYEMRFFHLPVQPGCDVQTYQPVLPLPVAGSFTFLASLEFHVMVTVSLDSFVMSAKNV